MEGAVERGGFGWGVKERRFRGLLVAEMTLRIWDGSTSSGGDRDGDRGSTCLKQPQIRSCSQAHPLGHAAGKAASVVRALCDPSGRTEASDRGREWRGRSYLGGARAKQMGMWLCLCLDDTVAGGVRNWLHAWEPGLWRVCGGRRWIVHVQHRPVGRRRGDKGQQVSMEVGALEGSCCEVASLIYQRQRKTKDAPTEIPSQSHPKLCPYTLQPPHLNRVRMVLGAW